MAPWLIITALTGLVIGSHFVPTPDEVQASFKQAQKFYAAEDYQQAIETYERINRIESPLLFSSEITTAVGEIQGPIREIALYQTGNSYLKDAQEKKELAARSRDPRRTERYREQATANFAQAATYFRRTESEALTPGLSDLARNRLVTCLYESGAYDETVEEGRVFLEKYPDSGFRVSVLYNVAWAYFDAERYAESIGAFENLQLHFPTGYRADRAQFQIGEAYFKQERYAEAVPAYQKVVDRQNIGQLSERELLKMRREKMAGLVDETAIELAAKAQIKIGDSHARNGDSEAAAQAYRKVIAAFAQEQRLVSEAYIRLTKIYSEAGDRDGAVRTYHEAIDGSQDRIFQAGMQSLLAQYHYDNRDYDQAISEYRLYLDAYGDVAAAAGLAEPWARYKIGRAHFETAGVEGLAQRPESARASFLKAIEVYESIERDYPHGELAAAAVPFNIGLCHQLIGGEGAAVSTTWALERFEAIVEDGIERDYVRSALFQIGRIRFERGDYRPAIEAYEQILEEFPGDPQLPGAQFELALCHRDLGEIATAVTTFDGIDSQSELFAKAMLEASNLLAAGGDHAAAIQALDRGLASVSAAAERARFFYMKGRTLIEIADFEGAVGALSQAIDLTDDDVVREGALYGRGVSLLKLRRLPEAASDLQELVDGENPEMAASARRMLGLVHLEMGREEEAIAVYESLAAAAASERERAEHLAVLAELHYSMGNLELLESLCRELISADIPDERGDQPYTPKEKAYFLLGDGYGQQKNLDGLVATYREALDKYPDSYYAGDMRFALGQALFDSGDLVDASEVLESYLQAHERHSNRPYGYYYLGYAVFNLTRFERAALVFGELATTYPGSELAPDALFRAGEAEYNLGRFDVAMDSYQRLLDEYPAVDLADDALYNKAWSLLNLEREKEALAGFARLSSEYSESPLAANAQFTIGDFLYNEKRYAEALDAYEVVLKRFPDSKVAQKVPPLLEDLREVVAYQTYADVEAVFVKALEAQDPDQFRQAIKGFEGIVDTYPGTESEIGALSNMGVCYESLGNWKKAVEAYDLVLSRFEGEAAEQVEAYRFARMHKEWIETTRL